MGERGSEGSKVERTQAEAGCSTRTAQFAALHTQDTAADRESTRGRRGLGELRDGLLFLVHANSDRLVSPPQPDPTLPCTNPAARRELCQAASDRQCHCATTAAGSEEEATALPRPRCLWPRERFELANLASQPLLAPLVPSWRRALLASTKITSLKLQSMSCT